MKFIFVENDKGDSKAKNFFLGLPQVATKIGKKLNKFEAYKTTYLFEAGFLKKLDDDLFEIIIFRDYRLFGTLRGDKFYIFNAIRKKSQKTPRKIINNVKRKIIDLDKLL